MLANGVSKLDKTLARGSKMARRAATPQMLAGLAALNPTAPWHFARARRELYFPATGTTLLTLASTVMRDNEWTTYAWDGSWVEVPSIAPDPTTAFAGAALNTLDARADEIKNLKREVSSLTNQLVCMRHDLEREKRKSDTVDAVSLRPRRWGVRELILFFLIGSLLAALTRADYTRPSSLQDDSEKARLFYEATVVPFFENVTGYVTQQANSTVTTMNMLFSAITATYIWHATTLVAVGYTLWKTESPIATTAYLLMSTMTSFKFAMLAIAPLHTATSAWAAVLVMLVYFFDPAYGLTASILQLGIVLLLSFCRDDATLVDALRAHLVLAIVVQISHALLFMGYTTSYLAVAILVIRLLRLLTATSATTIELRDATGKIVSKLPNPPNFLFKMAQSLRRMRQLRTGMTPMVRIQPRALVRIRAGESVGTGFFCGNHIVTAGHVVASETAVSVIAAGRSYSTTITKHLEGKDIAFLKIPPELQTTPRMKVSKKRDATWVCVVAPDGEGYFTTATTPGTTHADSISYATPTRNGMSGAPVLDVDGRVLGVHQTNTGYTGGAVILLQEEVTPLPKESEVALLKARIAELEGKTALIDVGLSTPAPSFAVGELQQTRTLTDEDVVQLVRAAVAREFLVLRDELNQAKKGKTKRGRGRLKRAGITPRGRKQRGPAFTEEEYKELLEKGIDPDTIREMALEMLDDESEADAGFPEWSDPEFSDDDDVWELASQGSFDENILGDQQPKHDYGKDDWTDDYEQKIKMPKTKKKCMEVLTQSASVVYNTQPRNTGPQPRKDFYEHLDENMDKAFFLEHSLESTTKADRIILNDEIARVIKTQNDPEAFKEAVYQLDLKAWDMGLGLFQKKPKNQKSPGRTRATKHIN
nr:ORF1a [Rodent astrovirus]